jgi:hypothetical protein
MARIVLKTMMPWVRWDPKTKRGQTDENTKFVLEIETAQTKAGMYPFRVGMIDVDGEHWREQRFTNIDDALENINTRVREFAKKSGWTPESEN